MGSFHCEPLAPQPPKKMLLDPMVFESTLPGRTATTGNASDNAGLNSLPVPLEAFPWAATLTESLEAGRPDLMLEELHCLPLLPCIVQASIPASKVFHRILGMLNNMSTG